MEDISSWFWKFETTEQEQSALSAPRMLLHLLKCPFLTSR